MKQLRFGATLFGAVLLAAAVASAQAPAVPGGGAPAGQGRQGGGAPPAPLKNLKVFPKEMTQAQIIPIMRNFEGALQVECGHCHQWTGQGAPGNDFSADVKPQKEVARAMIKMVDSINQQIAAGVSATGLRTGDQIQKVTCATCHRGSAIPQVPTYQPPAPAAPAGRGAAPAGGGAPAGGRGN